MVDELGAEATVSAAGIISYFNRMVRVADSIGIPVDPPMQAMSADLRGELGIDDYHAAANTPAMNPIQGFFIKLIGLTLFRRMLRKASH